MMRAMVTRTGNQSARAGKMAAADVRDLAKYCNLAYNPIYGKEKNQGYDPKKQLNTQR